MDVWEEPVAQVGNTPEPYGYGVEGPTETDRVLGDLPTSTLMPQTRFRIPVRYAGTTRVIGRVWCNLVHQTRDPVKI